MDDYKVIINITIEVPDKNGVVGKLWTGCSRTVSKFKKFWYKARLFNAIWKMLKRGIKRVESGKIYVGKWDEYLEKRDE